MNRRRFLAGAASLGITGMWAVERRPRPFQGQGLKFSQVCRSGSFEHELETGRSVRRCSHDRLTTAGETQRSLVKMEVILQPF